MKRFSALLIGVLLLQQTAYAASAWDPTLLVNTESFQTIDAGDGATDIELQFGDNIDGKVIYDKGATIFRTNQGLTVGGDLTATGSLSVQGGDIRGSGALAVDGNMTINEDNDGADAVLTFGNDLGAESIRFSDSANLFLLSDDIEVQGSMSGHSLVVSELSNCPRINTTATGALSCGAGLGIAQIVTVAKSGGDYTSIKEAIESITDASATKQYAVLVYPGTYTEDPFVMKQRVNLISAVGPAQTKIVSSTASADLITASSGSFLKGFTLGGITTGSCLFAEDVQTSHLVEIIFGNCELGVYATGSTTHIIGIELHHHGGTMLELIRGRNGAQVDVNGLIIEQTTTGVTTGVSSAGSGTVVELKSGDIEDDGMTNGILVNSGGSIRITGLSIEGATYGIHIHSGDNSNLKATGLIIDETDTYDLFVESSTANIVIGSAVMDRTKVKLPSGLNTSIIFNDEFADNKGSVILGELAIGTPENPTEAAIGEGDHYTDGMLVYTENTSSVFTDVSTAAISLANSTFTFPGTATNNAIYISTSRLDKDGNPHLFLGMRYATTTALSTADNGDIVFEYWNGSAWTEFAVMCTHAKLQYRYSNDCFIRPNNPEQVRFDENIADAWVTNDPPSTGTDRYWIRMRLTDAVSTAPVFEQFRIVPNHTEIDTDGTVIQYGGARNRRSFINSIATIFFGTGPATPDNFSIPVGTSPVSWTDTREKVAFTGLGINAEEVAGSVALPFGIDTSTPLRIRINWVKQNSDTGNVQWKLDYLVRGAQGVSVASGALITPQPRQAGELLTGTAGTTIETSATGSTVAGNQVGSSRVDLQACKLEYSIVSPK